jgi:hypothetical protein
MRFTFFRPWAEMRVRSNARYAMIFQDSLEEEKFGDIIGDTLGGGKRRLLLDQAVIKTATVIYK